MPTPVTSATPYCTTARLLDYCDWTLVADWAADPSSPNEPRPTRAALLDATSDAGKIVARFLAAGASDIEQACFARGMYVPADLAALTGNAAVGLEKLNAGLTLWGLANRRNPGSADMAKIPGAKAALDTLEALRKGEKVFPLAAQIDAGSGMDAVPFVDGTDPNRLVNRLSRLFGGCD